MVVGGFCWGGAVTWMAAARFPELKAGGAWYGRLKGDPGPENRRWPMDVIADLKAPVLGLYGENDQRVNATIARADSVMRAGGQTFEQRTYTGAGHGFLRAQDQVANAEAAAKAWPETISWFRKYLR